MHYIIYISTALKLLQEDELALILKQSRKNNTALDVTGMLLYSEGTFIQALEGNEQTINKLYTRIEKDKRHKNIIQLIAGESDKRTFPDWSMAYLSPDKAKMSELEGYINPENKQLFKGHEKHTAITVMKTFAENNNLLYPQ